MFRSGKNVSRAVSSMPALHQELRKGRLALLLLLAVIGELATSGVFVPDGTTLGLGICGFSGRETGPLEDMQSVCPESPYTLLFLGRAP